MSRKLVTLREVKKIKSIENADNIELARVDGWQCVVKKGEFKEGDLGLYFEVDSVLPEDPRWDFLERYNWRIRTVKLRGVISQGLLLPLDILTDTEKQNIANLVDFGDIDDESMDIVFEKACEEKINLSNVFSVEKYVHPDELTEGSDTAGGFPGFIRKTDQERIQNLAQEFIDDFQYHPFEITEKLEGTSITIYYYREIDEFGVCSRNLRKKRSKFPIWDIIDEMEYEDKLKDLGSSIALQGELIGPKIQGNVYGLDKHEFRIFDIWDIEKQEYMIPVKRYETLGDLFNISVSEWKSDKVSFDRVYFDYHVPIMFVNYMVVNSNIDDLLEAAEWKSQINDEVDREGLVFKSMGNSDVSFKVINNEYLTNNNR